MDTAAAKQTLADSDNRLPVLLNTLSGYHYGEVASKKTLADIDN